MLPRDATVPVDGDHVCRDGMRGITEWCEGSNTTSGVGGSETCDLVEPRRGGSRASVELRATH